MPWKAMSSGRSMVVSSIAKQGGRQHLAWQAFMRNGEGLRAVAHGHDHGLVQQVLIMRRAVSVRSWDGVGRELAPQRLILGHDDSIDAAFRSRLQDFLQPDRDSRF